MNVLDALEQLNVALLAAEDWAEPFYRAPKQHAQLIKMAARAQRQTLMHFRDISKHASKFINWYAYSRAVNEQQRALQAGGRIEAYDIDVIVDDNEIDQQDQQFIRIIFDTIATATALGAASLEIEHGSIIGLTSTSSIIQNLTTQQLANLVGMTVDKNTGLIIPNRNPIYNIDETTRTKIAQSIKTSIQLGENHTAAVRRLQRIIADPARADMIAYTETVRAYGQGRKEYALQSNAVAKRWYDTNATDECTDNTSQGWIPVGQDFISGDEHEPAHPNCKCSVDYSYDTADLP